MRSVTACALNLPNTNTDWNNALGIDLCTAQNKHCDGALSNDLCAESEHDTENRRADTDQSIAPCLGHAQ